MKKIAVAIMLISGLLLSGFTSTKELDDRMEAAHSMAEAARALGYDEDHYIIQLAKQEYMQAYYNKQDWLNKQEEYPNACYIWEYLHDNTDWNDAVIAGILGNIMVEVGGNTLNISPLLYGGGWYYYGICQWNYGAFSDVFGQDLEYQLNFLITTIEKEFNTYGTFYKYGFGYEDFLTIEDAYTAGLVFATVYERGFGTWIRANCAVDAYNYFTN